MRLGQGGSGDGFLAVDKTDPETQFVVKRVDPNGIPLSFRREVQVMDQTHTHFIIL